MREREDTHKGKDREKGWGEKGSRVSQRYSTAYVIVMSYQISTQRAKLHAVQRLPQSE